MDYRRKLRGEPSDLTDQKEDILNQLGIDWYLDEEHTWLECFRNLQKFHIKHGHMDVPNDDCGTSLQNKKLIEWISEQR
eukprot:5656592-Ditylum_brightwellii.AAC.1